MEDNKSAEVHDWNGQVLSGKKKEIFFCPILDKSTYSETFLATKAFESGMKPKTVQEILGHSSLAMTMDLYTHVTDDTKKKEMDKLKHII